MPRKMAESGIVQTDFKPVVFTILENIDLLTLNRVIFMECTYTCKILHFYPAVTQLLGCWRVI